MRETEEEHERILERLRICTLATGRKAGAAALLTMMLEEADKLRKNGVTDIVVAKSAEDWQWLTGLKPKQYKTAIRRLRELGLVSTEQHLVNNKNITHTRVLFNG